MEKAKGLMGPWRRAGAGRRACGALAGAAHVISGWGRMRGSG